MRKEGKELDELTAPLKEPLESTEIRYKILEKDFRACGEKIIADLTKYAEEQDGWCVADDNREGIRVSFDRDNGDGWFLLRLSVHDPIMPLNVVVFKNSPSLSQMIFTPPSLSLSTLRA